MAIWSSEIKELEELYESLKGQLPDLEKELEQLIKTEDANVIMLYSRRCLEVLINDLCECELKRARKTEPLQGIIDKLNKEEKVPSHIIASMHGLNSLSTFGTHPKDFDPEQVRPVLVNLVIIIKWYQKYKNIVTIYKTGIEGITARLKEEPREKVKKDERIKPGRVDNKKPVNGQISRIARIFDRRRWGVFVGIILALMLIIVFWYFWPFMIKPQIISKNFESSVAVLAFDDISDVQGFQNFAVGATDNLISRLERIQGLKVVPIIESLKYKQLKNSTRAICKDNNVKMVIQGSVKAESGKIALETELIDGERDIILWKQSKADKLENILNIQDEMVTEIAQAINVKYSSYQVQKLVGIRPTKNFKAYELFLKGNEELTKWTYENLKESLIYYRRALDIDQNYIKAYANSALANLLLAYFYDTKGDILENIKKDAKKTLSLEDDNEVALMSMEGYYILKMSSGQKLHLLEYRDMLKKLKRLILKNPSSPMAFFGLAEYYRLLKKDLFKASEYFKLSLVQCEKFLQSDPSNGIILGIAAQSAGILGQIEFKTGNFLEAIRKTEYSIKLVPGVLRTYIQLTNFYFNTDQPQKARVVLDQALSNVSNAKDRGFVGIVQGRYSMVEGKYEEAEKYWADAMTNLGEPQDPYYDYALLYRFIMLYKLGNTMKGDSLIHDRLKTKGINSWPEPVIYYFAGSLKEEELVKLAKKNWQKCEAFFFLGEKYLLSGKLTEAKNYFEQSVNTKESDYIEYDLSQAELSNSFKVIR